MKWKFLSEPEDVVESCVTLCLRSFEPSEWCDDFRASFQNISNTSKMLIILVDYAFRWLLSLGLCTRRKSVWKGNSQVLHNRQHPPHRNSQFPPFPILERWVAVSTILCFWNGRSNALLSENIFVLHRKCQKATVYAKLDKNYEFRQKGSPKFHNWK